MLLAVVALILVIGPLAWVTIGGHEAWPFSAYPMFSQRTDVSKVRVVRIALETAGGERIWWRSHFYRYPEAIGLSLKRLYAPDLNCLTHPILLAQQQKLSAEVVRLLRQEEGDPHSYRALYIIGRTVAQGEESGSGLGLVIEEQVLAKISLTQSHD